METREINGVRYRLANYNDHYKIINFYFDVFLKGEPATLSRGGYVTRPFGLVYLVQGILEQYLTIIAEDVYTNLLIGVNTNVLFKRYVHQSLIYHFISSLIHVDL